MRNGNEQNLTVVPSLFVCHHASPQPSGSPDAGAQTFELHDLAMIDEKVHLGAIVLDVPGKDFRICCLKHHFVESQRIHNAGGNVCAPRLDTLGDSFALNHHHISSGVQETLSKLDRPSRIACAFGLELLGPRRAARSELDPDFWFRFQTCFVNALDQTQPVICWQGDESTRHLNDVEAELLAFANVAVYRFGSLRQNVFDESAG